MIRKHSFNCQVILERPTRRECDGQRLRRNEKQDARAEGRVLLLTTAVSSTSKYYHPSSWMNTRLDFINRTDNVLDNNIILRPKKQVDTSLNLNWEENSEDEVINIMKDKANTKVKIMNVATAMATLGMANARGLEDPSIGPMLLSHAFQSRIHVLEESRAFSLIHQKKQDWFSTLPAILRTQKHTNTRNKYRVGLKSYFKDLLKFLNSRDMPVTRRNTWGRNFWKFMTLTKH